MISSASSNKRRPWRVNDVKVKVKKISPYPIPILITTSAGPLRAQILYLEPKGVIVDTASKILVVSDVHQAQFELPVSNFPLNHAMKVIKTYDRTKEGTTAV